MKCKFLTNTLFILVIFILMLGVCLHINNINQNLDSLNASSKGNKPKLTILIEVDKKRLSLVDRENEKVLAIYTIATGKSSSPTPLGSFQIVEKAQWGEGFGSRWLGLNVPWGKYGIHGTNQPGSIGANVSGGCIRMRNSDVEDLYDKVSHNTQVIIMNGEFGPFGQGFRTLKPGDRGADVLEVQKRLSREGFYDSSLDGIYGEGMKRALIEFLKYKNIPITDKIDERIYKDLGIILMN
ncbi:MAG: L,D-transpeptidase family protein [Tissierellaceae bacterium]|nr:L,D-transpeptidase family protein [Tissierellaceae bacterium]